MTTPMIGIFRAKAGKIDELLDLVRRNVSLLRSKGCLSSRSERILRTKDGIILFFEYGPGGAEQAHNDPDVMALWAEFVAISDSLGMHGLPEGEGSLPGAVAVA